MYATNADVAELQDVALHNRSRAGRHCINSAADDQQIRKLLADAHVAASMIAARHTLPSTLDSNHELMLVLVLRNQCPCNCIRHIADPL